MGTSGQSATFSLSAHADTAHLRFLALHDFSRYIIAVMLMPLLKLTGRGVVLDVLSAGVWNKFDDDDLQLHKKSPNFFSMLTYNLS